MNQIEYRKDIDALRGLSVLLVVIYHAFPEKLPGGFIGVDIFFVISGYLITSIIYGQLKRNEFSFLHFYNRRIRRIFPALFTVLLASLIIGWFILFPDEYTQLARHVSYATIFIQNFTLIEELGYFDVASHYKPLLHLWTLSIEEQYYLLWPAILVIIFRFKLDTFKILITIILISFVANIYFVRDYKDEVFFHSITRFWELGLGSLLARYLYDNKVNIHNSKSIFILGLTLILLSVFWINHNSLYPYWLGLFPTIGAMLIIIANLQLTHWAGLVKIGLISYPLYLWHWVIISFCYIYLGKKPNASTLIIAIILSLLVSYLTYRYIEKIRYMKSNKVVFALLLLAITVGIGTRFIKNNDGMPNRSHLNYLKEFNIEFQRTPAIDKSCESYVASIIQDQRLFDYCRSKFIENNNKLIAIIGDSHAHALFPGIAEIANNHGYNTILLANSSCPPLIQFMWGRNSKEIHDCQIKIKQILTILKDKRIEKIVFATRGPIYIEERQTYEKYFDGFEKTLSQLNNAKHIKNIYYFLENPELDFLPKEVIIRPFDYWEISKKDSIVDRNLYQLRMKKYKDLVFKTSSNFAKVNIIDVEPYMCEDNRCFAYKNGNFLYADDNHFSVFGSFYIARKTENIIFSF